ncbi:MAG: glycosyl hydrolase 2 galactose-binding domain-containing protein [Candidatus Kryptoniota bacterium]
MNSSFLFWVHIALSAFGNYIHVDRKYSIGMKSHFFFFSIAVSLLGVNPPGASASGRESVPTNHWQIQSSAVVNAGGSEVSSSFYVPKGWYAARVPSTILGDLIADGICKDPLRGENLARIPDSLFEKPWWYRTTFVLPARSKTSDHVVLKFLGINYKADIWLNGQLIANGDSIFGGFRQFAFDATKYAAFGRENVLAVEVSRPEPGDFTVGFVDWNPTPPDHDMGLWRPVELHITGDVSLGFPFVATDVDTPSLSRAKLTVSAEVTNMTHRKITGTITGTIRQLMVSQLVTLSPGEKKIVTFMPADFNQLVIKNPRLWWTYEYGKPNLYSLHLEFVTGNTVSDSVSLRFGIRRIDSYMTPQGYRGFKLNGRKILLRGGGWTDRIFLDQNENNLKTQVDYAINMHLNTLRMEGFWGEGSDIYNLCDEKGILIMAGWSAQWEWPEYAGKEADDFGAVKSNKDMDAVAASFQDQVKWLRNHPSIFAWLYGSDKLPRPELEEKYLGILAKYDTTRPALGSAAEHTSVLTGKTGVKMRGPYDYVPPVYWFADTLNGGAFGFNTETGPGPEIPIEQSLDRMLSPDSLWPINGEWIFHCPRGSFPNLTRYNQAIDNRLGIPRSLRDYERKAQYTNYEGLRAMFEAFGAMKFKATGVIQWMYNAAWPKLWWQLFDYYLQPTAAFYGAQKACEPLHVEYDPADSNVYIVNSTLKEKDELRAEAGLYDFQMKKHFQFEKDAGISPNTSMVVGKIPRIELPAGVHFLDLRLYRRGKLISSNFYALSTVPDVLDWSKSTWYITPESQYADLTELNHLHETRVNVKARFKRIGDDIHVTADLKNTSPYLAFMVHLSVVNERSAESISPVFWNDNYISILPGQSRKIEGYFHAYELNGGTAGLKVSGWNVSPMTTE